MPLWLDAPTVITHGALPGARDAAVLRLAVGVPTEIARRRDDDDPRFDGALGRERQRIGVVRLVDAGGDRQVDDADVERVLVRDRVVDRGDDVADVALAVAVEHFQDDERRARRDAAAARRPSRGRCPR